MYKGRTTIEEIMNLPNRLYYNLFHFKRRQLEKDKDNKIIESEVIEDAIDEEGGI